MSLIRKIYLYLFSLIGLVLVVIGCVELVNLGLKAYVFTAADQYYAYPTAPAPKAYSPSPLPSSTVPTGPTDAQMQAYQDEQTKSQRESTAAYALAMIIVGAPLYLYHWRVIKKDQGAPLAK
jgi:hypothetical protein